MDMKTIDQYILGGAIASLLGFLLFYYSFQGNRKSNRASIEIRSDESVKNPDDGECQPETAGNYGNHYSRRRRCRFCASLHSWLRGYLYLLSCVDFESNLQPVSFYLLQDGRLVLVIERDLTEPDRIVGELLQPGGYLKLIELGLEDCVNEIDAQRVLGCGWEKFSQWAVYTTNAGEGCITSQVNIPSCFVALILKNCQLPYRNHGHVILANPSPILLYQISSTEIRCLVDVPGQKVPSISNGEMAHYLKTKVAPQIPRELYCAFMSAIDEGNIRTMPNRSMPAAPYPTPGALLLGDAFNMRHPLTGRRNDCSFV
ncbi:hypothetical protein F0562_020833 [Nyssa sinensis]|uniref:Squalene monooxygenase n=1 Tax=Nyssa sinensis TaxID=561372 RepID=A0A5J5BVB8_9ASTE|nr:hypothetical protein F0562_020833 [Nyssa sinensis]